MTKLEEKITLTPGGSSGVGLESRSGHVPISIQVSTSMGSMPSWHGGNNFGRSFVSRHVLGD